MNDQKGYGLVICATDCILDCVLEKLAFKIFGDNIG
jgi:hypothetical protein